MSDERKRKRQGLLAIIGGLILIITGVHANLIDIRRLIHIAVDEGFIPSFIGGVIIQIFLILGFLAGIPIIIGGLMHITNKTKIIANWLIVFGTGISILDLFSFMITTSPAVKLYLISSKVSELSNVSFHYLLLVIGLSFSFLAIFADPMAMILGLVSSLITSISGSIIEVVLITSFLARLGVINPSPTTINLMRIIFLTGVIFLLAGYLAGIEKYRIAYIITLLSLLIYFIPIFILIVGALSGHLLPVRLTLSIIGEIVGLTLLIHVKISLKSGEK